MTAPNWRWSLHAYAILSRDDRIADASGEIPPRLQNEADWAYFQAGLDRSRAVLVGRAAHEASPNRAGRVRIIMSHSSSGLQQRRDGWWWNPDGMTLADMLAVVVPTGGEIGVPGGRGPFDYLLKTRRLDAFHLSRVQGLSLPGGVPVFSACEQGETAASALAAAGLQAGPERALDTAAGVTLTVWQRPAVTVA